MVQIATTFILFSCLYGSTQMIFKIIWDSWVALVFTMSNNRDMIHVENGVFVILLYTPDFDHTYM